MLFLRAIKLWPSVHGPTNEARRVNNPVVDKLRLSNELCKHYPHNQHLLKAKKQGVTLSTKYTRLQRLKNAFPSLLKRIEQQNDAFIKPKTSTESHLNYNLANLSSQICLVPNTSSTQAQHTQLQIWWSNIKIYHCPTANSEPIWLLLTFIVHVSCLTISKNHLSTNMIRNPRAQRSNI